VIFWFSFVEREGKINDLYMMLTFLFSYQCRLIESLVWFQAGCWKIEIEVK